MHEKKHGGQRDDKIYERYIRVQKDLPNSLNALK